MYSTTVRLHTLLALGCLGLLRKHELQVDFYFSRESTGYGAFPEESNACNPAYRTLVLGWFPLFWIPVPFPLKFLQTEQALRCALDRSKKESFIFSLMQSYKPKSCSIEMSMTFQFYVFSIPAFLGPVRNEGVENIGMDGNGGKEKERRCKTKEQRPVGKSHESVTALVPRSRTTHGSFFHSDQHSMNPIHAWHLGLPPKKWARGGFFQSYGIGTASQVFLQCTVHFSSVPNGCKGKKSRGMVFLWKSCRKPANRTQP